jgi:biotin carboxyl carrier protein
VACVAYIFRPFAGDQAVVRHWGLAFSLMTSLAVLALLLEVVLAALLRVDEQRARFRVALVDELRVQLPLGVAVAASSLLIAFAAEVMGLAALATFTAPLLVTQVAFRRYAGIRATYLQTVRALAKVTEIGGYVEAGHSERVSRIAVAVGRELGVPEPQLLELEYAALMHDIGQLSLADPIPGGATVLASRPDAQRIAELGAEVIQQARVLGSVAEIVRRQNEPYRDARLAPGGRAARNGGPGGPVPPGPPLASRIIKAANAFDDLVGSSLDPARAAAAVQQLRLGTASEYDPRAVEALSRVVTRRSVVQMLASCRRARSRPLRYVPGRHAASRPAGQNRSGSVAEVRAEMVANVSKVLAAPGDHVDDGDTLVILESMKMEIPVLAETAGTVTEMHVAEGDVVQEGDVIAVIG